MENRVGEKRDRGFFPSRKYILTKIFGLRQAASRFRPAISTKLDLQNRVPQSPQNFDVYLRANTLQRNYTDKEVKGNETTVAPALTR